MESSQPENGLVIEKMTLTVPHDVPETESKVCCNGAIKDSMEFEGGCHTSVDPEHFPSKGSCPPQVNPATPFSGDSTNYLKNGKTGSVELDCLKNCEGSHCSFTGVRNCETGNDECVDSVNMKENSSNLQDQPGLTGDKRLDNHPAVLPDVVDNCEQQEEKRDNDKKCVESVVDKAQGLEQVSSKKLQDLKTDNLVEEGSNSTDSVNAKNTTDILCLDKQQTSDSSDKTKDPVKIDVMTKDNPKVDGESVIGKSHNMPPQIFEDITEDEDEDEETFENIELELDDLIDPAELSRSSGSSEKGKCDIKILSEESCDMNLLSKELCSDQAEGNIDCSLLTKPDTGLVSPDQEVAAAVCSGNDGEKTTLVNNLSAPVEANEAAIELGQSKPCSTTTVSEGQLEKKEQQSNIYTIISTTNTFKAASSDISENDLVHKHRLTARKSGKPVNQIDCSALKTIDLHPIKNITMKLSDVQEALDFDPLRDSGSNKAKCAENACSTDTDSNSTLTALEMNSAKLMAGLKKKKRKNTYDFPGFKKKQKRVRSDELESLGSSADSVSLSDGDFQDSDSHKDFVPHTDTNTKPDSFCDLMKNSHLSFSKKLKSSSSLSSSLISSGTSPSLSSSSALKWPSAAAKPTSSKANSKMKSVLDMLHARSKQKAEMEEKKAASNTVQTVSITTNATSTTTTILVSPPPNKPIIEGVKRKGTPRKRREDVICLSDSEDSGEKRLVVEGKRKRDSLDNVSAQHLQLKKQKSASSVSQAPVVMVVAQHSSAPGLRSLLPRHALASPTSPTTGNSLQHSPGSKLGSYPLISTLPVGAKAISLANLPPGVTAVPITSLSPGSQPAVTFFTTVPASIASALPIPISGTNLASIASPVQLYNNSSPGKSIKTTSSGSISLPSTKTSNASHSNSDSLRALLVGKPYTFSRVTSASSPQLTSTPMLFQMVTATGASLVPIPAHPVTLTSSVSGKLKSSSAMPVSRASYSLLKSHPPVVPNGISCLTPPKTPDTDSSSEVLVAASLSRPVAGQVEDSEVIPLCCCKISGASFNKLFAGVTYCQALDTVDHKVLGCYNKVTNPQLVRPGVKIPFMAFCEVHHKRLKLHQCCPGCGHFCTQGKFQQCRKEGKSSVHTFHKQCVFYRGGKYYCPHCGEETNQCEVELQLNEEKPEDIKVLPRLNKREAEKRTARIRFKNFKKSRSTSEPKVKTITLPNSKVINIEGLPLGPDHQVLTRLCRCVTDDRPKKYRTLPKDLYTPASEGDIEKVFFLLVDGMDANTRYDIHDDQTAMHAAATAGSVGAVFILTQFGAEIHVQDKNLRTPVMCAAENGNLKAVQFLIKAGAKVEDRGEDGMTSLHYAAKAGYIDVVQHILETGKMDVNTKDDGGWTPIMWATELQMPEVVKYLLTQGGDPNKKDNEENTSLHWAAFSGSLTIAEMFLDSGCEIDAVNEHGDRPLHIAARQDHYDMVVLLLARGADVDTRNNKSESPVESCTNKSGQVWMALKVNQQLRSFAAWKVIRPERLVERDITMGREKNPIACVNSEDNEPCPVDYLYVTENVETSPLNINYVITSLQSCRCKDDCSSMYCVCGRSSIKCWYDKMGRLLDEVNLLEPPLVFECNRACRCWVNCNNRVVQNGITCRVQMFKTNGRGWGVRALMDIPKGTFVCEYIGELISDSEADRREDDSYLFDLDNKDGDTYCIDARKYGNISRFINHLCEPNLVPVKVFVEHQDLRFPRICLFSSRDIMAYEELGFDYGEKFWMIKWKHFTCACKSAKCKYSIETIKKTLADYKLRYPEETVDI